MATSSDMLPPSEVAAGGYDQDRRARLQNHVLTAEELKVLQECNRESFIYRALPLGLGSAMAVQYGTKMGYLTPHPKYGPYLKMMGAGFIGWMVGKFSYRRQCEEKLMKLPNSVIGDALRRKYGMASPDSFRGSLGGPNADYSSTLGQDRDLGTLSSQSLDLRSGARPQGLDDNQRPSMDRSRSHTASQGLDDRHRPSIDSMRSSMSPQGFSDSERPSMDTDRKIHISCSLHKILLAPVKLNMKIYCDKIKCGLHEAYICAPLASLMRSNRMSVETYANVTLLHEVFQQHSVQMCIELNDR